MQVKKANAATGNHVETVKLTPQLLRDIANGNGYLTMEEVLDALEKGAQVYTSFNYYVRIEHP